MANYKCQQKAISMRILVACEYSGIVRDAFAAKGHDAWSCDVLPTESPGNHIQDDVLNHLDKGWDMMIAHPPCTYLSKAGARWLYPKAGQINQDRYNLGIKGKEFFMRMIDADINKIAVENPTPLKVFELPKPTQAVQPYEYGHKYSKRTLLWLKNLPKLHATKVISEYTPYLPSNKSGAKRGQRVNKGVVFTAHEASKTFLGIAQAMADQWS